jgi:hypothetical protein
VPNFKYVLIHIGNDDDDTAGCLLVGETVLNPRGSKIVIGNSTSAYAAMYKKVSSAIIAGEEVTITYTKKHG